MSTPVPTPALKPATYRRLRIGIVTETYPPEVNGVAMTVRHLVEGLLARGHRVQLVRPRQATDEASRREGALEIEPQSAMPLPFYRDLHVGRPAGPVLSRLWRQDRPDLVHLVTEGPLGYSALRAARRLNLPVTSCFHTNFHAYSRHYGLGFLHRPIAAYLRRFHNRCDCTLVPTEDTIETLCGLGLHNLRMLPRGVNTNLFSPRRRSPALRQSWGLGPEDPAIAYVGRLAAEKNLELAVTAFQALRKIQPRARFVVVGDGPMGDRLRALYPEFVFCGMRRGEDLAVHFASVDVFLFPSLTETFGNVTLEAMASGLAVVAFDYAAARRYLVHDRSGLLAPLGDEKEFVALARNLIDDPQRIRMLGRAARKTAQACGWERIYVQLEEIFLEFAA